MRIHSNTLSAMHIINALNDEKAAGRIARSVTFKTMEKKGSRTHANAFEVQLESYGKEDGDGRRRGNSGSYGAMNNPDEYAATYDEWGFLIAAIYEKDPDALFGSVKYPVYADDVDFHEKTGFSYSQYLPYLIDRDGGDPYPYVNAKNGVGRRGAGRTTSSRYSKFQPRTADEVRAFQKREKVEA